MQRTEQVFFSRIIIDHFCGLIRSNFYYTVFLTHQTMNPILHGQIWLFIFVISMNMKTFFFSYLMGVLPLLHIFHVQHKAGYLEEFLKRSESEKMNCTRMVERWKKNKHFQPDGHAAACEPYLHVVGSWDVGCSFEGVRHISQDLRGKEKVATVVAPPLQKLQETPYDLRHPLPGQGPLTLREMLS